MKISYKLSRFDSVEATMTITMTIADWKGLKNQIESKYPGWELMDAISSLIMTANREFEQEVEPINYN